MNMVGRENKECLSGYSVVLLVFKLIKGFQSPSVTGLQRVMSSVEN